MPAMVTKNCKCCGKEMQVRVADHNRGWGKFCSKSCKAIRQTQRNGYNPSNWRGSGVSKETYEHYASQCGGIPQFNRRGEYVGFVMSQRDLAAGGYGDADWNTPMHSGKDDWF